MKKIIVSFAAVFTAGVLLLVSCTKQAREQTGGVVFTAEAIASEPAFQSLTNAISRFDPQYLRLVFKERRSVEDLTKQSKDLLLQLNTDPANPVYLDQLARFYHFRNADQLTKYSATISSALKELDSKYDFARSLAPGGKVSAFAGARQLVAKSRLNRNEPQKNVNGLWSDFVDAYFSEFDYNSYVYDQGLEEAGEGGGGDECNGEKCCYERQICLDNARSEFWQNLAKYGGGGTVGGGGAGGLAGAKIGSFVGPEGTVLGSVIGGLIGGIIGGVSGTVVAYNIYSSAKDVCKNKYQICLASK